MLSQHVRSAVGRFLLLAILLTFGVAVSATPAHAVGVDDNCPAVDDGKNLIVSDAAVIYGTAASDHICGGPGPNVIIGGLLDDEIYGGGGDDVIIGGHGVDILDGGSGNDWLRGGTNGDTYVGGFGGSGTDTASFADMTPTNGVAGLVIDLAAGTANAGGAVDDLSQIDNVVGSAFNDDVRAANGAVNVLNGGLGDDVLRGTAGNDSLVGDGGADSCTNDGAAVGCVDGQGTHRPSGAFVEAESRAKDWGLVVMGAEGSASDSFDVTRNAADQLRVTSSGPLTAGASCSADGSNAVNCALASARYVVVSGDDGNDTVTAGPNLNDGPGSIDINGGRGNDNLTGGTGDEVLFTGEGGADTLNGNAGMDALISEGDPVGSGGDYLAAGDGDDQLVTDNACAGHTLWGGPGRDIIGFARQTTVGSISAGVHAQLGEGSVSQQAWAIDPVDTEVAGCARSSINGGGEVLEGTNQNDVLSGNSGANTIWARQGNDTVFGNGGNDDVQAHVGNDVVHAGAGNDTVLGQDGNDTLYGDDGDDNLNGGDGDDGVWGSYGVDSLYGGPNWDDLHAQDGAVDSVIDCGTGYDPGAERDGSDPAGVGCDDPVPTNAYLTVGETLNGQPGYVSVSGNVQRGDDGTDVSGYVNVNFEKLVNGSWQTMSTAQRTLSNGHYDVSYWGVGVGQWRVRAVFPASQGRYAYSESSYHPFEVKSGYRLVARHSGKCMSLSGNSATNGTAILQWDCSPSPSPGDGQVFTLVPFGNGDYELKINSTGKCVDVSNVSTADGAALQEYDCLGAAQANQLWKVIPIAGQSPYVAFQAKHSGKCADVSGVSTANGARLQQWTCLWGGNQQWSFQAI
jgi:Ca2+-binding RTX toxin-like protein